MGHQDPGCLSPKIDISGRAMGGRSRSRSRDDRRDRGDRHKSSRRRSRSRDRSRSRSKHRSRDRSRSRSRRDRRSNFDADPAQMEAMQRYQQETIQKQLLAQQLMLQQQGLAGGLTAQKKQREVYVGNLTIGVVTDNHLRELFNGALAHLVPDPVANPPVVSAQLDPSGRFGFVEMRSEELASSAMQLDKVEVCGRQINVGRPKGYTEPPGGAAPAASLNAAQIFAASLARRPSTVLLLENMLKAYQLHDDSERNDLLEDVKEECSKYGTIHGIAVPKPPAHVRMQPGRVYIRFSKPEETEKAKAVFNGRQFDGNVVVAKEAPEEEFDRANAGQWTGGIDPPVAMYAPVMTS